MSTPLWPELSSAIRPCSGSERAFEKLVGPPPVAAEAGGVPSRALAGLYRPSAAPGSRFPNTGQRFPNTCLRSAGSGGPCAGAGEPFQISSRSSAGSGPRFPNTGAPSASTGARSRSPAGLRPAPASRPPVLPTIGQVRRAARRPRPAPREARRKPRRLRPEARRASQDPASLGHSCAEAGRRRAACGRTSGFARCPAIRSWASAPGRQSASRSIVQQCRSAAAGWALASTSPVTGLGRKVVTPFRPFLQACS